MSNPTVAQPRSPDSLAQAIRERTTRGLLLFNTGGVLHLEGGLWAVPASQGGYWRVDLAAEICPCEDFAYCCTDQDTGQAVMNCKHIVAAALARAMRPAPVQQDHPHACVDGWVYLGYTDGEGNEQVEGLPCRRCAEEHAGENFAASRPLR